MTRSDADNLVASLATHPATSSPPAAPGPQSAIHNPQSAIPRDAELRLRGLPPLLKPHYFTGFQQAVFDAASDQLLYQLGRVAGSLSLMGESTTPDRVARAIKILNDLYAAGPHERNPIHRRPPALVLHFKPYSRSTYRKDEPDSGLSPLDDDDAWIAWADWFQSRLSDLRDWCGTGATAVSAVPGATAVPAVPIVALLETERFIRHPQSYDPLQSRAWNTALAVKHANSYLFVRNMLAPRAIHCYNRNPATSALYSHLDGELGDYSVAMYHTPDPPTMLKFWDQAYAAAQRANHSALTPWISFAPYRFRADGTKFTSFDDNYPTRYDWALGRMIHSPAWGFDAPANFLWCAAQQVCVWPQAFDPRMPHFFAHFSAYCWGAEGTVPEVLT